MLFWQRTAARTPGLFNAINNGGHCMPERVTLRDVHARDRARYAKGRDERPAEAGVASCTAKCGDKDVREIRAMTCSIGSRLAAPPAGRIRPSAAAPNRWPQ